MSNEKDEHPGWRERAGRRLNEFSQWVDRRCGVPLRRFVRWLFRLVETVVEGVVLVVKTTMEAVVQNQTVKTTVAGAKAAVALADKALHLREWYERMGLLVAWLSSLIQNAFCSAKCSACTGALVCTNAYAVALAAAVISSLFILYIIGTVIRT